MFWFEYKYKTTSEVLDAVKLIIDFSPIETGILIFLVLILALSILYIFPFILLSGSTKKKERAKKKRKKLLNQISMQKEIEDEIAAEIEASN